MKKKIIFVFAMVGVFALAIAAYAYTQSYAGVAEKASCCAKKDSCPMKGEMASHTDHQAGKSCPMGEHGARHASAAVTGEDGCCGCACCADSCPMNAEKGQAAKAEGESCCTCCDCCGGEKTAEV